MGLALKQAQMAFEEGEVPIGAIVVCNKMIIGKGYNQVQKLQDPTAHAEILAITAACNQLGNKFLNECDLYITIEPCLMCFGAIENARIANIFFGAYEPKTGFSSRLKDSPSKVNFQSNILESECANLMITFFQSKRTNQF
jgi:tRNA(adenine34) deaminase